VDAFIKFLFASFLIFQTVHWFVFQLYRIKLDHQPTPVTELQAQRILLHVRLILFWLLSDYYTERMKEAYYLAFNSPEVSKTTSEAIRRSMKWRMVRGLPKMQKKQIA